MARLLFIEDNPNWQDIVQRLLRTAGYEVRGVRTLDAAIDILSSKQKFEVVVFDLSLGEEPLGTDPFVWLDALIEGLKARKLTVPPIIIVTGVDVTKRQIIQAFTEYRDNVFSFFEKRDFDPKDFLQSTRDSIDYSPARVVQPKSFLQLFAYTLLMIVIVLSTFGGLLWSVQQIADPKTQQAFLQIGGALIIAIPLFILIFIQRTKIEDVISSIAKIGRD